MLLNYLLLSAFLSATGFSVYHFLLKKRLSAIQSKYALYAVLLLSWMMPLLVPALPEYSKKITQQNKILYSDYSAWNIVDIEDEKLLSCYDKAADSRDVCDCEVIQKAEIITFQQNPYYDFLIAAKYPVLILLFLVGIVFLLEFLIKIGFLIYLALNSYRVRQELNGVTYYLLYPKFNVDLPLSAFTLWNHYVIWSPVLDTLESEDRKMALNHELAHLQQKDSWQQIILQLHKLVWWMLPHYYWIRKEFNRLNEFVADEYAAKKAISVKQYASLLLKVKAKQQKLRPISLALALVESLLKKRVLNLMNNGAKIKKTYSLKSVWSLPFILFLMWGTATFTQQKIQQEIINVNNYQILKVQSTNYPNLTKAAATRPAAFY